MDCGCGVSLIDDVVFCPMHEAAPELLKALQKAPPVPMKLDLTDWKRIDHWFAVYDAWIDDVQLEALALVEGKGL